MARKQTLDAILSLFQKLGGNTSEVLGTKTNVNFLGKGKSPELMLDMDINADALAVLPRSKAVEELTNSVGYAVSGKLNDIQANQLLKNMQTMDSVYFPPAAPKNVTDFATGTPDLDQAGLMSLRQGRGDLVRGGDDIDLPEGVALEDTILPSRVADDLPPPGSRGGPDDIAAPLQDAETTLRNLEKQDPILAAQMKKMMNEGIMSTVTNRGDMPGKRASAREFLVEALKKDRTDKGVNFGKTQLNDVISAEDVRYITEGGGGIGGDPIMLVEKYFGPRIVEALPSGATGDEIVRFTKRVLEEVVDAAGNKPGDPRFDRNTAKFIDEMADGGRAGFRLGKSVFSGIANMFKKGADDIDLVKQEETFRTGPITEKFLGDVDKRVIDKFIRTRDTKGPGSFGMYDNISEMPQGLQAAEFIKRVRVPGENRIDYEKAEMFIGGGIKLTGKETIDELIEMYINAMKSYKSPFKAAKGGLAKILEV